MTMTLPQLAIYKKILSAARTIGPFTEDPKKKSIHLACRSAFAGVATRRNALTLTLKSAADIPSSRIAKREQISANRWHLEMRLEKPADVDRELTTWLEQAMALCT